MFYIGHLGDDITIMYCDFVGKHCKAKTSKGVNGSGFKDTTIVRPTAAVIPIFIRGPFITKCGDYRTFNIVENYE